MALAFEGEDVNLGFDVSAKCRRRADRLVDARIKSSQFSHLKNPEIERLKAVNGGVILSGVITESEADEIASNIHKEFPWLQAATNEIWNNMRTSVRLGRAVKIGPVLMNGPPGIGKTAFSSFVAKSLKLHFTDIDASSGAGKFSLTGLERGWSSAGEGRVIRSILQNQTGNPLVFVDELDKAGGLSSNKTGERISISDALLPLIESESSQAWTCPFFGVRFDMSKVSYILASNSLDSISEPLMSRMTIVNLSQPDRIQIMNFAEREARRAGLSDASTGAACDALLNLADKKQLSLRDVKRTLQRAEALESRPTLH